MGTRILQGDCRAILPTLPARGVQCVVTSPPYFGLRDYGTAVWSGGDPDCKHVVGAIRTGLGLAKLGERYAGGGHKPDTLPPIVWRCQCGARSFQHHQTCAACGEARPRPIVATKLSHQTIKEPFVVQRTRCSHVVQRTRCSHVVRRARCSHEGMYDP